MVTIERQASSRLIALNEDSRILGYTEGSSPNQFLRELGGRHHLAHQVRIYDVCPLGVHDLDHYYDFEAQCLLQAEPDENPDEDSPGNVGAHH
jgi:hypothetical protein